MLAPDLAGTRQEVRNGLFLPFTGVAPQGTDGEPSSGLGLSSCKTFVEAQGGTFEMGSEEGQGSRCTVRLSWRAAPAGQARTAAPKLAAGGLVRVQS